MKRYTIIVPNETRLRFRRHLENLRSNRTPLGARFARAVLGRDLRQLTEDECLEILLNTKSPRIFAESEVAGDGTDWHQIELEILGDISISMPVTVYDNGHHTNPEVHEEPFPATLIYTPGALLRNGKGQMPVDWKQVVRRGGKLWKEGYYNLYERRLLPVFEHINAVARERNKMALVTVPGMGCGQFAGPFRGNLGMAFQGVLKKLLSQHNGSLQRIEAIYYDPYDECTNQAFEYSGHFLRVRPLMQGNENRPQLCHPKAYEERDKRDFFRESAFFSIVAWDHVSWPGNDFFAGCRQTDDGVKAAATNSMAVLTGIEGYYDKSRHAYMPPAPYDTWEDVVRAQGTRL